MNWFNTIRYPSKNLFFKKADEEFTPRQISEINEHIFNHGYPPDWALDWANSKIKKDDIPKEWVDGITKGIEMYRNPIWASNWVRMKLWRGEARPEWIKVINDSMLNKYPPPDWAETWIIKKLINDEAPQAWLNTIKKYMAKGDVPKWAFLWAKKEINKYENIDNVPEEYIECIHSFLKKSMHPPDWASDWVFKIINSGKAPLKWIDLIASEFDDIFPNDLVRSFKDAVISLKIIDQYKKSSKIQEFRIKRIIFSYNLNNKKA